MEASSKQSSSRGDWTRAAALAALVIALYWNSLGNEFVWDDRLTAVPEQSLLSALSTRTGSYYRPVVMASFGLDRLIWGDSAFGFHVTNIACHLTVTLLLACLARENGFRKGTAFAAAILFAAHPVQTEAVTYISGRTDILSAVFILLAFLAWRRSQRSTDAYAIGCGGAVLLALLSKEACVALPFILLLRQARAPTGSARPAIPIGVACAWFLLWSNSGGPGPSFAGLASRLPAVATSAVTYVHLLLWPSELHLERFSAVNAWDSAAIASVGLLLGTTALLAWGARLVPSGRLWLGIAVASYLPVSGIVPIYPAIADRLLFTPEHFLYLPLLGLAPLIAGGVSAYTPSSLTRMAPIALAIMVSLFARTVIDRNRDWRDEETLFRHTLRYEPPTARVWFNLGNLRLADGELAEARTLYEAALSRAPRDSAIHLNLAITHHRAGRLREAKKHYRHALVLDPEKNEAHRGLAAILLKEG